MPVANSRTRRERARAIPPTMIGARTTAPSAMMPNWPVRENSPRPASATIATSRDADPDQPAAPRAVAGTGQREGPEA